MELLYYFTNLPSAFAMILLSTWEGPMPRSNRRQQNSSRIWCWTSTSTYDVRKELSSGLVNSEAFRGMICANIVRNPPEYDKKRVSPYEFSIGMDLSAPEGILAKGLRLCTTRFRDFYGLWCLIGHYEALRQERGQQDGTDNHELTIIRYHCHIIARQLNRPWDQVPMLSVLSNGSLRINHGTWRSEWP